MENTNNDGAPKKRVTVIEPPIKVELVSRKTNRSLPLWAQWAGLGVPIILSIWALYLTISDSSQMQVINRITALVEKQDSIIHGIKQNNESIETTQKNTYNLLQATLQQNEDFKKINQPIVRLRLKGYFSSPAGNDEQVPCVSTFNYYIENLSLIPAKYFSGTVGFISGLNERFEGFYGYTTWSKEIIDLTLNNPIVFGVNETVIPCDMAGKFFDCFVVFAYSYQNEITGKSTSDTLVFKHKRTESYQYYYMKPLEGTDLKNKKAIIKGFLKGGFYPSPS